MIGREYAKSIEWTKLKTTATEMKSLKKSRCLCYRLLFTSNYFTVHVNRFIRTTSSPSYKWNYFTWFFFHPDKKRRENIEEILMYSGNPQVEWNDDRSIYRFTFGSIGTPMQIGLWLLFVCVCCCCFFFLSM